MHLHELMGWPGPMTDLQFQAWTVWQEQEWNRPSRTDYYLMKLYSAWVKVDEWPKIKFGEIVPEVVTEEEAKERAKQASEAALQNAMRRAGTPETVYNLMPDGTLVEVTEEWHRQQKAKR